MKSGFILLLYKCEVITYQLIMLNGKTVNNIELFVNTLFFYIFEEVNYKKKLQHMYICEHGLCRCTSHMCSTRLLPVPAVASGEPGQDSASLTASTMATENSVRGRRSLLLFPF